MRTTALATTVMLAACVSTSYLPARGPEVRLTWEGGHEVYVRDGRIFDHDHLTRR